MEAVPAPMTTSGPAAAATVAEPPEPPEAPEVAPPTSRRPIWRDLTASYARSARGAGAAQAGGEGERPEGVVRAVQVSTDSPDRTAAPPTSAAGPGPADSMIYCRFDARHRRLIDFRLPGLDGKPVRFQELDADLILLDFWGTWCTPCVDSIPQLVDIQNRLGRRIKVVGIVCEQAPPQERPARVGETVRRLGINYPVLLSGMDGESCPVQEALQVQAFPTLILLDRNGRILWRDQGATPVTLNRLKAFIAAAPRADTVRR